jgi:uncharacterized protein YdhG (YjbR/CyaY superfamily)
MTSDAKSIKEYLESIPPERKASINKLRKVIKANLPEGFREEMSYGMIGFVVPHSLYPKGYHVNPKEPLPFINIASQKNYIAFYHMGIYEVELLKWFQDEYKLFSKKKLDMGKVCIRFKKEEDIPYEIIGELSKKISVEDWIFTYESSIKSSKKG